MRNTVPEQPAIPASKPTEVPNPRSEDESDSDQDIFEEMFKEVGQDIFEVLFEEIFLNKTHGERRCMGTCYKSTCSDPKKCFSTDLFPETTCSEVRLLAAKPFIF